MDDQHSLHVKRLEQALGQLPAFRERDQPAWDPEFQRWKDRALQSLRFLWGMKNEYVIRFQRLGFWQLRVVRSNERVWDDRDQTRFDADMLSAEEIIRDALEEVHVAPSQSPSQPAATPGRPPTEITVNVTNVLSQSTTIQLTQVLAELDELDLSREERDQATKLTQELAAEARNQRRWPVLARPLEQLRAMGKTVYERVAIPLLLEMLKKQAGL